MARADGVQAPNRRFRNRRTVIELLWQGGHMRTTGWNLLTLLACLCAGAGLVAGCAATPGGYSNSQPGVRCNDTGTTAERHACR